MIAEGTVNDRVVVLPAVGRQPAGCQNRLNFKVVEMSVLHCFIIA
jgi:hypothetical protein